MFFFFFQAEDGIRDLYVTGVQTCALPIFETDRGITQRTRQRVQGTHGISCAKRVPSTNLQQTRDLTRTGGRCEIPVVHPRSPPAPLPSWVRRRRLSATVLRPRCRVPGRRFARRRPTCVPPIDRVPSTDH